MIYRVATALAILVLIVGSVLLSRQQRGAGAPMQTTVPAGDLGYAARDAELIETGPDGNPVYILNAELIRQRPQNGNIELEAVQMRVRDGDGNRWTLRADRGRILADAAWVELIGNVHVAGLLPGTDTPDRAEIFTEMLSFDTRTEIVSTNAPVRLVWSGRELHANGLSANLKERRVRLESSVHGLFTP